MKKVRAGKRVVIVCLIMSLLLGNCMPAYAKSKDVTKKYKARFEKILKRFDVSFQYGGYPKVYYFDNYTRTSMLILGGPVRINVPFSQVKKNIKGDWKKYFTKKFKPKMKLARNYTEAVQQSIRSGRWELELQIIDGKVQYIGGNSDEYCRGKVTRVIRKNKKTYIVTYDLNRYGVIDREYWGHHSTYKITFKKQGSKFRIANIKRTCRYS